MEAEGEIMKKISSALLAALLLLATVFTGAPTAMAAGVSVNHVDFVGSVWVGRNSSMLRMNSSPGRRSRS